MRITRLYVSILIIYAALSGIVVFVSMLALSAAASDIVAHDARLAPPSANVAFLHLTDCVLPCWVGIIPGKTTISEAQALIRQVYARQGVDVGAVQTDARYTFAILMRVHDQATQRTLDIRLNNSTIVKQSGMSVVKEIYLYAYTPRDQVLPDVNVGTMIALLGQPQCLDVRVLPTFHEPSVEILYPQYHTALDDLQDYGIVPNLPVAVVIDQQLPTTCTPESIPWRGFISDYGYYADQVGRLQETVVARLTATATALLPPSPVPSPTE